MRQLALAVLVLLSATASASELYIVPAFAKYLGNGTTWWTSELLLTNPHDHAVSLEMELTAGEIEPYGCRYPEMDLSFPSALGPRQTRYICMPFTTAGAFAFRSSEPIVVTSEMVASRRAGDTVVSTRQSIEPGRRWIEPGERALIPNVRIAAPSVRANLILFNPGNEAIEIRYDVIRVGSSPGTYHDYEPVHAVAVVPPRSMKITPLAEGTLYDCGRQVVCGNAYEHEVTLESSGRFYAVASSIENELDAVMRSPLVIP